MPDPTTTRSLLRQLAARVERSQHVFLLGLVAAFAVEIVVDWNATFREINVLRAQLGDKCTSYATVLRLALADPVAAGDATKVAAVAGRLLEDDEVSYVRVCDHAAAPLVEAGEPLGRRFPHQLDRDVRAMLADPAALRRAIASSRHRDFFQAVSDREDEVLRALLPRGAMEAPAPRGSAASLAFQDRLYDEGRPGRREDRSVVWALAVIERADGDRPAGVLVVAARTASLKKAIDSKLRKGLAITLFFLGVIAYQQLSARRAKLRMLSMQDALLAAREAVSAALPTRVPEAPGLVGGLAFRQAERLGGTVYGLDVAREAAGALDLFVALPEGSGVDVAFASIFLREAHQKLRDALADRSPEPLLAALAEAYDEAPIHRRLQLALLRIDGNTGQVRGVLVGTPAPVLLDARGAPIPATLTPLPWPGAGGPGGSLFQPPFQRLEAAMPPGATLVLLDDGLGAQAVHPLPPVEVGAAAAELLGEDPPRVASDLLRRLARHGGLVDDDLFVLVVRRAADRPEGQAGPPATPGP